LLLVVDVLDIFQKPFYLLSFHPHLIRQQRLNLGQQYTHLLALDQAQPLRSLHEIILILKFRPQLLGPFHQDSQHRGALDGDRFGLDLLLSIGLGVLGDFSPDKVVRVLLDCLAVFVFGLGFSHLYFGLV
jgi:hypothetical protein